MDLRDRIAALMPRARAGQHQIWEGVAWPPEQFRTDACLLDGVALLGDGTVSAESARAAGMDPITAQDALVAHLEAAAPWGVRVAVEREASGAPFQARTGGPAYRALATAMAEA